MFRPLWRCGRWAAAPSPPGKLLTYGFLHGNFNHLFFNMFAVWMFGVPLESSWGSQRFAQYFVACVVGAAVIQLAVQLIQGGMYPTVGASGGVFGLLLAYGVMWPRNKVMLIFLPIPIEARWFVLIYGVVELMFGVTRTMPGIAHFAHLGGMIFGALLLWRWGWRPRNDLEALSASLLQTWSPERVAKIEIERAVSIVALTPGEVDRTDGGLGADEQAARIAQIIEFDIVPQVPHVTGFQGKPWHRRAEFVCH